MLVRYYEESLGKHKTLMKSDNEKCRRYVGIFVSGSLIIAYWAFNTWPVTALLSSDIK